MNILNNPYCKVVMFCLLVSSFYVNINCTEKRATNTMCMLLENLNKIKVSRLEEKIDYSQIYGCKLPIDILDSLGFTLDFSVAKKNLICFWFVECKPCIEEIPYLNLIDSLHKDQIKVIGFCLDSEQEIAGNRIIEKMNYKNFYNAKNLLSKLKIPVMFPTSFVINENYIIENSFGKIDSTSLTYFNQIKI